MARYKATGERLSNWGRWGDTDERGTLNLLTPERVVAAAASIRTGRVFDLGIPVDAQGPQPGDQGGRINPVHTMSMIPGDRTWPDGFQYADDWITMPLQAGTQWDALAHVSYDGEMYNGFPTTEVTAAEGARRLGIEKLSPIAGRGVLLDVARLRGVDWLEAGARIEPAELDAAVAGQGVEMRAGDVLLLRTGWWRKFVAERSAADYMAGEPGLTQDCADWIHARDLAAIGCDNWGLEVSPSGDPDDALLPLHCVLIRDMGMPIAEILDLEELAEDCARDGVWDFFFAGPPLKVTGGAGSPVNPLAIK